MTIKELYNIFQNYPVVCTDTRKIISESLFFALKGENFDGNLFWKEALHKGASYSIVDDPSLKGHKKCIYVNNVLNTLQKLAAHHRKKLGIPIIAITGTNGKTTTKELTGKVLGTKLQTKTTTGNFNNHIGVPLTLLSFDNNTEIGIVEMGANHIGEIGFLCEIALPDYGIITNIGKAHIEGFGSIEGVVKAKTELYKYLQKSNGIVFCNARDELLMNKSIVNNRILYGKKDTKIYCEIIDANPFVSVKAVSEEKQCNINTQLIGKYNMENIETALCIGLEFGIDLKTGAEQIEGYSPKNMRSQWKNTPRNNLIIDTYNANPTSLKLAIENFVSLDLSNKVVILGDMLELGDSKTEEHQWILNILKKHEFKDVFLIGEYFYNSNENSSFNFYKKTEGLLKDSKIQNLQKCNILIKGSRGIGLEKIIHYL